MQSSTKRTTSVAKVNILALETSGVAADVALLEADENGVQVVASRQLPSRPRTAQTLAPAIASLLQQANWQPADVGLVAVATGPGSFTGLRLGVTTAKVFAYATGADVQGVNTLDAVALNAGALIGDIPNVTRICTVMDAQRNQVFAATYSADAMREKDTLEIHFATSIIEADDWRASLATGDLAIGPGLIKLLDDNGRMPGNSGVNIAPVESWQPTAAAVAELAWRQFSSGKESADVWSLVPQYFRASAAEEKRATQ